MVAVPRWRQGCACGLHTDISGSERSRRCHHPGSGKAVSSLPSVPGEGLFTQSPPLLWNFLSTPNNLGGSDPIPNMPSHNPWTLTVMTAHHQILAGTVSHFMVLHHQ